MANKVNEYGSYKITYYLKWNDTAEPLNLTIVAKSKQMACIMFWRYMYMKNKTNDVMHAKIVKLRANKSNKLWFEYTHTDSYMKKQLDVLKMEYADNDETILKIREDADR